MTIAIVVAWSPPHKTFIRKQPPFNICHLSWWCIQFICISKCRSWNNILL